jgi:hypothetical protein
MSKCLATNAHAKSKREGQPCGNAALDGSKFCALHQPKAEVVWTFEWTLHRARHALLRNEHFAIDREAPAWLRRFDKRQRTWNERCIGPNGQRTTAPPLGSNWERQAQAADAQEQAQHDAALDEVLGRYYLGTATIDDVRTVMGDDGLDWTALQQELDAIAQEIRSRR